METRKHTERDMETHINTERGMENTESFVETQKKTGRGVEHRDGHGDTDTHNTERDLETQKHRETERGTWR